MNIIVAVIVSYLIGSIPFGYLLARAKGLDIMKHGSGNIGATNVWRNLGPVAGLTVLFLDMAKGVAAILLGKYLGGGGIELLAGLAVLCGHSWSIFLRFKGGKMIATGAGVVLAISPVIILVALVIWLSTVAITRYVSMGSMLAAISVPVTMVALDMSSWHVAFGITIAVLAVHKHRSNIARIINGTEFKVVLKGGKK